MTEIKKIRVEVSNRHVHLSREHIDALFGKGYELNVHRYLSQPGHFAAHEKVSIINGDRKIEDIRILGPPRKESQIEISRTDAFNLRINAPLKHSGDLEGSSGILIIGPMGSVELEKGVIISHRHVHISPEEAELFNLKHGQFISLKVDGIKSIIFNNVMVRVDNNFKLTFHIDFDEANACFFEEGMHAEIIETL